ncbi:LexA family protein [Rhodoferax aquaticus]|uniref:Translesion error-prone DNA polymerase V autoproteolytic subunit n=1 Tax=Rhodoferax aquaticus TaxID=2527691 RepID=A0A515EQP2_9BURK|nr:translesion error-prone DNA polymerase V autoproteolytic subunit [Rhodoferax aquaticus]QDL54982.1 translesion error-prone DNA polymerase V autoproteolytic subunit [Rhodoferax aquaticus]
MSSVLASNPDFQVVQVDVSPMPIAECLASVKAGFPSPAEDLGAKRIDLSAKLVKHPQATFLIRATGDSMMGVGIADQDVLIVDRAIRPANRHVVIAVVDGEFVCKTLSVRAGRMKLKAANPCYADIVPKDGQTVEVWGVVTYAIKAMPV